jgi:CRISPR-associated DxTHG motif protein
MSTIVITFLGKMPAPPPKPAQYTFDGQTYVGQVFPEALRQFVAHDRMYVFVTAEARATSLTYLTGLNDARITPVDIPDGRSADERWTIFDKLVGVVADGDTVIFDITHGFRSIPFFVFQAIAFLKSARRDVTVARVLYGEFGQGGVPGPVIDLTDLVHLLDWMSATDQFIDLGNSRPLVEELEKTTAALPQTDPDRQSLAHFANALGEVSDALQLVIADRAMSDAHRLRLSLRQAHEPLQRHVRPFLPLVQRVDTAFAAFALPEGLQRDVWQALARERRIIAWYLRRRLFYQAIALAFEWLISYALALLADDALSREDIRLHMAVINKAERLSLNQLSHKERKRLPTARAVLARLTAADRRQLLNLFADVSRQRNDLMHASKTVYQQISPGQRETAITTVCQQLLQIPLVPPP